MSLFVELGELGDDASAFHRLAEDIDRLVHQLGIPALAGGALAGRELQPAQAAFEDIWHRCSLQLSALADSARRLSATVHAAAGIYQQTDAVVAADARKVDHAM